MSRIAELPKEMTCAIVENLTFPDQLALSSSCPELSWLRPSFHNIQLTNSDKNSSIILDTEMVEDVEELRLACTFWPTTRPHIVVWLAKEDSYWFGHLFFPQIVHIFPTEHQQAEVENFILFKDRTKHRTAKKGDRVIVFVYSGDIRSVEVTVVYSTKPGESSTGYCEGLNPLLILPSYLKRHNNV